MGEVPSHMEKQTPGSGPCIKGHSRSSNSLHFPCVWKINRFAAGHPLILTGHSSFWLIRGSI
jgi:hypothetical protein